MWNGGISYKFVISGTHFRSYGDDTIQWGGVFLNGQKRTMESLKVTVKPLNKVSNYAYILFKGVYFDK